MFGLVLLHTNHCNCSTSPLPSSPLWANLRVIDLVSSPVWWEAATNNIPTIVSYLMPNPLHTYYKWFVNASSSTSSSHCAIRTDIYVPFLATLPYRPLLPAGLLGYIPYQHRAALYRFELVVLSMLVHVKVSAEVHHLWVPPYFSSCVLHVWFVWLWYFLWWVVVGRTAAALWVAASMTCSILIAAFLCSCRRAFSPYV